MEHNYWYVHIVCWCEKRERDDQLALSIMMWQNKNKQVTSKEKKYIGIKIMCSWVSDWDPYVDSDHIGIVLEE